MTASPRLCYSRNMKQISLFLLVLLCACAGGNPHNEAARYRVNTDREKPYYLSADPEKVEDTCPGHDIIKQYNCTADDVDGLSCLDVYMVQGSPVPQERYRLLQETIEPQTVSAEPACPAQVHDCNTFLNALDGNLEFSWYVVNFPSSSFEACRETYDCKRIDCYRATEVAEGENASLLISCVYKKNQIFFVGSDITCQKTLR